MALLTEAQFREHVPNPLSDATLGLLLSAAEDAITAWAGAAGAVVELFSGGEGRISLNRRASAVTTVTETASGTTTSLAADDYRIRSDGYTVERIDTGTNPRTTWVDGSVTYTPLDDTNARKRVQLELVKLDLAYQGLQSHAEDEVQEAFGDKSYEERRTDILAGLREPQMRVIG